MNSPSGNTMSPLNHVFSLQSPRTNFSFTNALHPPSESPAQRKAALIGVRPKHRSTPIRLMACRHRHQTLVIAEDRTHPHRRLVNSPHAVPSDFYFYCGCGVAVLREGLRQLNDSVAGSGLLRKREPSAQQPLGFLPSHLPSRPQSQATELNKSLTQQIPMAPWDRDFVLQEGSQHVGNRIRGTVKGKGFVSKPETLHTK